jgi:putative redox protein
MVPVTLTYDGELRCSATHGPSGSVILTDAPTDNMGRGEAFSPTDLVATALGTCIATTMAIVAQRQGVELKGLTASVEKHMSATPPRRISKVLVLVTVPLPADHPERERLERAAHACPVHHSLHPETEKEIRIEWVG